MKKLFLSILLLLVVSSCTVNKKPEFIGIEKMHLANATIDSLTIEASALFKNENDVGGELVVDKIDVFIDNVFVATVSAETFEVPRQSTFTVPLKVNFPTSKILAKENGNILGAIINQVLNKKIVVNFNGAITYKLASFSFDYPIDYSEEIPLD